jgi:hypothetical protein
MAQIKHVLRISSKYCRVAALPETTGSDRQQPSTTKTAWLCGDLRTGSWIENIA